MHRFIDEQKEALYQEITKELRCIVCPNQSINDSHGPLADKMQKQIVQKIEAGQTKEMILVSLREEYGDRVLYNPPFEVDTLLLWVGPWGLLMAMVLGGVMVLKKTVKKR